MSLCYNLTVRNAVRDQIARAAGTVMAAFAISQLAGLVRRIVVLEAFGISAELDAFVAANRVSETLFNLVAGGALGSAFIPTFTALLVKDDRAAAWRLASAVVNLVLVILSALAALAAVFAPQIVRYALASGFSANPAQEALTIALLRIQLISAVLFGLSGLAMAVLNSHQVFLIPALTPAMYQLGLIFGAVVLSKEYGIYGLAYGVVIGAALHLMLQVPALLRLQGVYSLTLGWRNAAVGEVLRLMGPRLVGVAVVQLNFWVNTWLASYMAGGSLAAIENGFALMLMAQAALAQSVATAAMPTLAGQYALGQLDDMRRTLAASLRGVLWLAAPAAVGLMVLRTPIIALLYQRGQFEARSTELVAWALLWYAAGLVGHALLEVLARAFYALHDTRTPVLVGAAAMVLNAGLSFALAASFARLGWMPHGGLALANSLATAIEALALLVLMRRRLNGLEGRRLLRCALQAGASTLVMASALGGWLSLTAERSNWLIVGGGVGLGMAVYGLTAAALDFSQARHLIRAVLLRLTHLSGRMFCGSWL